MLETETQQLVDMPSIIDDIRNNILQNLGFTYKLRHLGDNIWTLRVRAVNYERSAHIEIIIDEYTEPEDRGARGAVFTYGDIPRNYIQIIMDSIMERI